MARTRELCWQRVRLMQTTTNSIFRMQLCPPRVLKIGCGSCNRSLVHGGLKPMIMFDQGQALLKAVSLVFRKRTMHIAYVTYEEFLTGGQEAWYPKGSYQAACEGNVIQSCVCHNAWRVQYCDARVKGVQT